MHYLNVLIAFYEKKRKCVVCGVSQIFYYDGYLVIL